MHHHHMGYSLEDSDREWLFAVASYYYSGSSCEDLSYDVHFVVESLSNAAAARRMPLVVEAVEAVADSFHYSHCFQEEVVEETWVGT